MLNTSFFIISCFVFYTMGVSTSIGEATGISAVAAAFIAYNFFLRSRLVEWIGIFCLITASHFIFFFAIAGIQDWYFLALARFTSLQLFLTVVYIWLSTPVPKSWKIAGPKRKSSSWRWNNAGGLECGLERI